jgi:hypothetical protein
MKTCRFSLIRALILAWMVIGLTACSHHHSTPRPGVDTGPKNSPEQGRQILSDNAKQNETSGKPKPLMSLKPKPIKNHLKVGNIL